MFSVFVLGDWNFLPVGERHRRPDRPDLVANGICSGQHAHARAFGRALKDVTFIMQKHGTHFNPASTTAGRLDRMYCASPGWNLQKLKVEVQMLRKS